MRITGGAWASRRLAGPPRGNAIRPTPDALREQGFAILSPHLAGAPFLDLFAGTGANALEALSRGAASAVAVERSPAAVSLIRRNLTQLDVPEERCRVLAEVAARAVDRLGREHASFPLVWCDPPFAEWQEGAAALALARELGVIAAGARVVLEVPPRREVAIPGFTVQRALRGAVLLLAV